jgi:hypothetical protein
VTQPSLPLFTRTDDEPPTDLVFGVFDVLRAEVQRACYEGADPEIEPHTRFSIDLPTGMEHHLRALATALGTSRRALAARLLSGAILDSLNSLQQGADSHEFAAVLEEYQTALAALRKDASE